MIRGKSHFYLLAFLIAILIIGCGGGSYSSMTPAPSPQSGLMSLSVTDAPPSGVTVLSFEVTVTGATLNPGNVALLGAKGPVRLEVKKLETENAFLNTASVPAGNYTSLALKFSNPELTFRNDTGAALAGCAAGSVCEITPAGPLSATVNGQFTSIDGMQAGVLLDLNLGSLLTQSLGVDFSSTGAVTATQQTKDPEGHLEDVDNLGGIVAGAGSTQFTLQTANMGNIQVGIDSNTQFENFDPCTANNSTCLQNGQSIEVDLLLMAGGSLLAKKIELHDNAEEATDDELDGVIFKIDGPAQFEMVVVDELRDVANVAIGEPVTVMLSASGGTSFEVDTNGLNVPSFLQQAFENQSDASQLVPGQTVQVRKRDLTGGPAPATITVTTDRVRLHSTRFTATISGLPSSSNFNVGNLPGLFGANGISLIQVETSSNTKFENVSDMMGLADGSSVSVRGLLFANSPNPVIVADKIRKR